MKVGLATTGQDQIQKLKMLYKIKNR